MGGSRYTLQFITGAICRGFRSNYNDLVAQQKATELCELLEDLAASRAMDELPRSGLTRTGQLQAQDDSSLLSSLVSAMEDAMQRHFPKVEANPEPEMIA